MSSFLLACALLATVPIEDVLRDEVDTIEMAHFYDEQGRLVWDQILFFEWDAVSGREEVVDFRLVDHADQLPLRDWQSGGYQAVWSDDGQLRQVRAKWFRETWGQYDRELEECEHKPRGARRELVRPPARFSGPA